MGISFRSFNVSKPKDLKFKEVALNSDKEQPQPYMNRVKAINALGLSSDIKAAEVLYQCLNDDSPGIRGWAAQNLKCLALDLSSPKKEEIKHVLSLSLKQENDEKVKDVIEGAIASINNENSKIKKGAPEILYTTDSKFPFPKPLDLQLGDISDVIQEYTSPEIAELRVLLDLAQKSKDTGLDEFRSIVFSGGLSDYKQRLSNNQYREKIKNLINQSFKDDEKKVLYEVLNLQSSS